MNWAWEFTARQRAGEYNPKANRSDQRQPLMLSVQALSGGKTIDANRLLAPLFTAL